MKTIFLGPTAVALLFVCPVARAATGDNSSMPQLTLAPAALEEVPIAAPQYAFSLTAASDYIFRGVSQTQDKPAIFGSARGTYDQFYAGLGAENVDFRNSTDAEYDLSAGWVPAVAGFKLDLGVVRYGYIDQPAHTHIDTVEYKAMASHDFGPMTFAAAVFYTPNYFGSDGDGTYFEGRAAYRITGNLTASGAVGRQTASKAIDHSTWNAGLAYAITKNIGIDARYYDTDEHSLGKVYGSHFVAAIKGSF